MLTRILRDRGHQTQRARLRGDLQTLGAVRNDLYFRIDEALRELANPNLHDVNLATAFRIELFRVGRQLKDGRLVRSRPSAR